MSILRWSIVLGSLAMSCSRGAPTPAAPSLPSAPVVLPLRSVRLYETGVGYFERSGPLVGKVGTTLPLPAAHIDDALKSLVVLGGQQGATVGGLEFESSVTEGMARALVGVTKEAGSPITYVELLSSLEGEEVELSINHQNVSGKVIDVVERPIPDVKTQEGTKETTQTSPPEHDLLLLTDAGALRKFDVSQLSAVRALSPAAQSRLKLAVSAVSPRSAQSQRMLRVIAESDGPVTLGYIAETPLWRTTYRLVLDTNGTRGVLMGWALMHNDTEENWHDVRVQLVNGRPDSFLFPFAAPRYGRRELVAPDTELSTIPQLLDRTPDAVWGDFADLEAQGSGTGSGQGFGSGSGRVGGSHTSRSASIRTGSPTATEYHGSSDVLAVGNLAASAQANGIEAGALFVYSLPHPLDLRAHGSALVPFVQRPVSAKRITWIGEDAVPRMAVLFKNDSGQTLPSGPISFFGDGGFIGENGLQRMKPAERSWLAFGADIDVEVETQETQDPAELRELTWDGSRLVQHSLQRRTLTVTLENRSGQPRTVHYQLDVITNAKVTGADSLEYDSTTSKAVAIFESPARKRLPRVLKIEEGVTTATPPEQLSEAQVQRFLSASSLPPAKRALLSEALPDFQRLWSIQGDLDKVANSIKETDSELNRFREHLGAFKGDQGPGPAASPLVKRVLETEDRSKALRAKLATHEEAKTKASAPLREALKRLSSK